MPWISPLSFSFSRGGRLSAPDSGGGSFPRNERMASWLVERAHDVLRSAGIDFVRFKPGSHALARRASLFKAFGVDLVFDFVGTDETHEQGLQMVARRGVYSVIGYGGTISLPSVGMIATETAMEEGR